MTASRAFAPSGQARESAPPVFPLLPYAYMAYVEHCSQDYAQYMDRLAHADEEPVRAGDPLGLQMLSEMNQAFFSLVWAPLSVAISRAQV